MATLLLQVCLTKELRFIVIKLVHSIDHLLQVICYKLLISTIFSDKNHEIILV